MMEINTKRKKVHHYKRKEGFDWIKGDIDKNHLNSFAKVDAHANEASLNVGTDMLGPQSEDKKAV